MIFRQLFEPDSSSYTYLLACPDTRQAVLIDPVADTADRDLEILRELELELFCTIETHIHADHLTGARKLNKLSGCKIAGPTMEQLSCVDIGLCEETPFAFGSVELQPLFTPGHTDTHHAYLVQDDTTDFLFSGDALLIDGCGRTDFQGGDAAVLYKSVHEKLFSLADDTLLYPGHDYRGRLVSTIGQEKKGNSRLGNNKSEQEFIKIMNGLKLPMPTKMEFAVPGNRDCGVCPPDVPEEYRKACEINEVG